MNQTELDPPDTERLGALARRLRISPRQLILVAARCTSGDVTTRLCRSPIIGQARAPIAHAQEAAALLLTPPTHFAQDELAPAIASVLPVPMTNGD
jgi:hypothetical protein